jgi:hypothetical protein
VASELPLVAEQHAVAQPEPAVVNNAAPVVLRAACSAVAVAARAAPQVARRSEVVALPVASARA